MFYQKEVIDVGDQASKLAHEVCQGSYKNSPAVTIVPHKKPDNFRGPVGWIWRDHILKMMRKFKTDYNGRVTKWTMMEEMENDGAGGKPQFFTAIGTPDIFSSLGWEIITMCADDFARSGRLPVIMVNELNIKKLTKENYPLFEALMRGYDGALRKTGLVNITGETAIMKNSITAVCDTQSD